MLRPPPQSPSPPASLFTTKSATFKALQTTAIPVRTGLVCLKPSVCARRTHYLTCVRIQYHGASTYILHVRKGHVLQYTHMEYHIQTTASPVRIRSCLSALGGRRQIYVYTVSPTKQWKTDECHRKLKKNVTKSRKATEN